MTDNDKLAMVRQMTGKSAEDTEWSDSILMSYIALAGQKIINRAYPYAQIPMPVPRRYGYLQCEIATYLLNKRGAEGESSHSENGISRGYENADIPESMLSEIVVGLELSWQNVDTATVSALLQAFNDEYLDINYLDAMQGEYVTAEFYVGNRSAPMYNATLGLWQNVSFNVIKRSGV